MITAEDVARLVRAQLRGRARTDVRLAADTELEQAGLSSLQLAEVVFTLEEEYRVQFDTSRAAGVRTIGDLVSLANESLAREA
ncbi:phosphopantetheine-binding protein [Amycolatopsis sp. NPDC005003]